MSKAVAIVGGVLAVGLLAGAGYYGYTHLGSHEATSTSAVQTTEPTTDAGPLIPDPDAEGAVVATDAIVAAQDEAARNDIAQVAIGQAAALSVSGRVATSIDEISAFGIEITTNSAVLILTTEDMKHYAAATVSESGAVFVRVDGDGIKKVAEVPKDYTAAAAAPAL